MAEPGRNPLSVDPSAPDMHDRPVIVGLDGREHDADAIALAQLLQASFGGRLLLTHVVPPAPPGKGKIECERLEQLLARASASLGDGTDTQLVEPCPAAQGLSSLAAERGASMLVLG